MDKRFKHKIQIYKIARRKQGSLSHWNKEKKSHTPKAQEKKAKIKIGLHLYKVSSQTRKQESEYNLQIGKNYLKSVYVKKCLCPKYVRKS